MDLSAILRENHSLCEQPHKERLTQRGEESYFYDAGLHDARHLGAPGLHAAWLT